MKIRAGCSRRYAKQSAGFSLLELISTLGILLTVTAIVLSLSYSMAMKQSSIANRSEMHSSVRSVTEILQQEITQAGRITFPGAGFTTLTGGVVVPAGGAPVTATLGVSDPQYLFNSIHLIIDIGRSEEIVTAAFDGTNITATFTKTHAAGAHVRAAGAFAEGILPSSDGSHLRMFGDINGDGNMVYIEYACNPDPDGGTLTRQEMPWNFDAIANPEPAPQVLLANLLETFLDDGTEVPCFMYQPKQVTLNVAGAPVTYTFMVNVAVTLTTKAQFNDLQTGREEQETKALLNVSPRNIFEAWELASVTGANNHVQPSPPNVVALSEQY